jgi:hypothetical protein
MATNISLDTLHTTLASISPGTMIQLHIGGTDYQISAADLAVALRSPHIKAVKVNPPFLRVRAQPGTSGAQIDQLVPDTVLEVIDIAPIHLDEHDWLPTADKRGWVAVDLTSPAPATTRSASAPSASVSTVAASTTAPVTPQTTVQNVPQFPTGSTTSQNVPQFPTGDVQQVSVSNVTEVVLTQFPTSANTQQNIASVPSTGVWVPPFGAHQRGVGASAGGWAPQQHHLSIAQHNAIEFVLVCAYEPGQAATTVPNFRTIGVKSFILRACIHEKPTTPQRFIDISLPIISEFVSHMGGEAPIIALGNEPNITPEGWGSAWQNGSDFATWWLAVAATYRQAFPTAKLGFPAMSPGGDVPNLRMNEKDFIAGASAAIQASDWVGVHYYWVDPNGADINPPLAQWRAWFGNKPIVATEVGPADANTVTPGAVQLAYQKFAQINVPACAWILTGSGAWHNAAWDEHDLLF